MVFVLVAIRPAFASGVVVTLLALIPVSLAAILIALVGMYFPVYTVGGAGIMALAAGLLLWRSPAA